VAGTLKPTAADRVKRAADPVAELVARIAEGLGQSGFKVIDVKDRAVLVDADGTKLMIGVELCK
jgi:hypothetical protein